MNCIRCGALLPAAARFCPACAAPIDEGLRGDGGEAEAELQRRRRRVAIAGGGGALVALGIGAAVFFYVGRAPTTIRASAPAAAPRANAAPLTPAQVTGFDWSGLTPEQLQAARAALDEAIAKEEQPRPGNSQADSRQDGQSAR